MVTMSMALQLYWIDLQVTAVHNHDSYDHLIHAMTFLYHTHERDYSKEVTGVCQGDLHKCRCGRQHT